ncbi:hypothetical protein, partial [Grimontia celer]|uniref:hypothetical protein n=1 Tax=Grimontia celer TaxID=1796497 RepID=UPI000AD6FC20
KDDNLSERHESVVVGVTGIQQTGFESVTEAQMVDGKPLAGDAADHALIYDEAEADVVTIKLFMINSDGQVVPATDGTLTEGDPDSDTIQYMALPVDADGNILATFNGDGTVTLKDQDKGQVTVSVTESDDSTSSNNTDVTTQGITHQTVALGQAFEVSAVDDYYAEGTESVTVSLGDIAGTVVNTYEAVTVDGSVNNTILEDTGPAGADDTVYVIVEASDDVEESDGASIHFTIKLVDQHGDPVTVPDNGSVTVDLKLLGNATAADFDDGFAFPDTLTIDAGNSQSDVITVPVKDDNLSERHESVVVGVTGIQQTGFESVTEAQMVDGKPLAGDAADHALIYDEAEADVVTIKLFMINSDGQVVPATDGTLTEGDPDSDTIQYMALPVDADGNILATFNGDGTVTLKDQDKGQVTVSVTESDDSTSSNNTDVTTQGITHQTVALGQAFEVSAVDDYYAE